MADFDIERYRLAQFRDVYPGLNENLISLALWMDGTLDTNIATGSKRYSSTNKRFETYNGTAWVPLIALDTDQANAYQIRVAKANEADLVGEATNALNLGGTPANQFVVTTDTRLLETTPRPCNNTFSNLATSRANLDVYSKGEMTTALGLKANTESPALTGNPTCPTQAMGNNSTRVASTAFVSAAVAALSSGVLSVGSWVDVSSLLSPGWAGVARFRYINLGGSPAAVFLDIDVFKDTSTSSNVIINNVVGSFPGITPPRTQRFASAGRAGASIGDVSLYPVLSGSTYSGDLAFVISTYEYVYVSVNSIYWLS